MPPDAVLASGDTFENVAGAPFEQTDASRRSRLAAAHELSRIRRRIDHAELAALLGNYARPPRQFLVFKKAPLRAAADRPIDTRNGVADSLRLMRSVTAVIAGTVLSIGLATGAGHAQAPLHDSQYSDADIAYGASIYTARCVTCHGTQGDGIGGVNLRSGTFRNAVIDRDLERFIRTGSPAGMPPFALDAGDMAGIIAYLRNMNTFDATAVRTGDAGRGRALFTGKGACTGCHRVGATGSIIGPNLSDVGAARTAGSIQRSLLEPTSQMMPINRPVRVVRKDGTVVNGRRLNEDTYSLQIVDEGGSLRSFMKADLREYTVSTTSPMPSYKNTLSGDELADVLAYLLSLKGQL
jgi:putative heme-binding domain-containing protein